MGDRPGVTPLTSPDSRRVSVASNSRRATTCAVVQKIRQLGKILWYTCFASRRGKSSPAPTESNRPRWVATRRMCPEKGKMNGLQEHLSQHLRETMERRIAFLLKTNDIGLSPLTCELSLIDLLNGIFLLEGQSETIGAYAGAVK